MTAEKKKTAARLLPFISFDIVSYAAGLTSMGVWPFLLATAIGELPATVVYCYVGGMLTGGATLSHDPFEVGDTVAVSFSLDHAVSLPEDLSYRKPFVKKVRLKKAPKRVD